MGDRTKLNIFSKGRLQDLRHMLEIFEREGLTKDDIDIFMREESERLMARRGALPPRQQVLDDD